MSNKHHFNLTWRSHFGLYTQGRSGLQRFSMCHFKGFSQWIRKLPPRIWSRWWWTSRASHWLVGWSLHQREWSDDACATTSRGRVMSQAGLELVSWVELKYQNGLRWFAWKRIGCTVAQVCLYECTCSFAVIVAYTPKVSSAPVHVQVCTLYKCC